MYPLKFTLNPLGCDKVDLGIASHLFIENSPREAFFFQIYSVKDVFAQFTM